MESSIRTGPLNHAAALERVRGHVSPLAVFTRLLFLKDDVPLALLRRYVPREALREWSRGGLLGARGASVVSRPRIDAVGPLLVLGDRRFRHPDARSLGLPRGDMVYPPSSDSLLLAGAVEPRGGGRALDLCTGWACRGCSWRRVWRRWWRWAPGRALWRSPNSTRL